MVSYVNPTELDHLVGPAPARWLPEARGALHPRGRRGLPQLLSEQIRHGKEASTNEVAKHGGGGEFAGYSNNVDLAGDVVGPPRVAASSTAVRRDRRRALAPHPGARLRDQAGPARARLALGLPELRFVNAEDQGYTLSIPLNDVDPAKQNGGLPVVSESVYRGGRRRRSSRSTATATRTPRSSRPPRRTSWAGPSLRNAVLDRSMVEQAYSPGDALLFSRFVFHKSAPFHEGPQMRRRAFVMRLIPASATFNPKLLADSSALFTKFGMHTHEDPVGLRLTDLEPGDALGRTQLLSRLF